MSLQNLSVRNSRVLHVPPTPASNLSIIETSEIISFDILGMGKIRDLWMKNVTIMEVPLFRVRLPTRQDNRTQDLDTVKGLKQLFAKEHRYIIVFLFLYSRKWKWNLMLYSRFQKHDQIFPEWAPNYPDFSFGASSCFQCFKSTDY